MFGANGNQLQETPGDKQREGKGRKKKQTKTNKQTKNSICCYQLSYLLNSEKPGRPKRLASTGTE